MPTLRSALILLCLGASLRLARRCKALVSLTSTTGLARLSAAQRCKRPGSAMRTPTPDVPEILSDFTTNGRPLADKIIAIIENEPDVVQAADASSPLIDDLAILSAKKAGPLYAYSCKGGAPPALDEVADIIRASVKIYVDIDLAISKTSDPQRSMQAITKTLPFFWGTIQNNNICNLRSGYTMAFGRDIPGVLSLVCPAEREQGLTPATESAIYGSCAIGKSCDPSGP